MIREVETNKVRKFEVNIGKTIYYILVDYDDVAEFARYYIKKEDYGIVEFMIGIHSEYNTIPNDINDNIVEWLCEYEDTIRRIEESYE